MCSGVDVGEPARLCVCVCPQPQRGAAVQALVARGARACGVTAAAKRAEGGAGLGGAGPR